MVLVYPRIRSKRSDAVNQMIAHSLGSASAVAAVAAASADSLAMPG
jgi:hypothetical protein